MANPIYPCLWFDGQAKTAADFYCSVFDDTRILSDNPIVVTFELRGTKFMALNAGPQFQFNEAVSFVVECDTQDEIDYYWNTLTEEGEESMCGWLKDKYGVSWQVVPKVLGSLMADPKRAERVFQALMKMKKLDIEGLENA